MSADNVVNLAAVRLRKTLRKTARPDAAAQLDAAALAAAQQGNSTFHLTSVSPSREFFGFICIGANHVFVGGADRCECGSQTREQAGL